MNPNNWGPQYQPYQQQYQPQGYYSRELNGRFGFEPAPVKDTFSYAGTASTAPATAASSSR